MSRERVYYEDKRRYLEARGVMVAPKNTRPVKLRDSLKELEVRSAFPICSSAVLYPLLLSFPSLLTLG